ncbi:hypothetical protein D3C81_2056150 [compost metagenome]
MTQGATQHVAHIQLTRPHIFVVQFAILPGNGFHLLLPGLLGTALLAGDAGIGRLLQIRVVQQHTVSTEDCRLRFANQRASALRQPVQITQRVMQCLT